MATPFFTILVDGDTDRDLREYTTSLSFEDSAKEDSYLNIAMGIPKDMDIAETPYIKNGMRLHIQFGFLQGLYSSTHICKVVDVTYRYADRITINLKCLDSGTNMKKTSSPKVWKKKTTIEIITEILEGYGMEFEYDEYKSGHKKWDSLPQGNKSDFDFIRYLVAREEGGNYLFYVRSSRGYLVQRANEESSSISYTYGDGSGVVMSFEPSLKESNQTGKGNSSTIKTTLPSGKTQVSKDDSAPKSGNAFSFDANGNDVTNKIKGKLESVGTPEQKKKVAETVGKVTNMATGSIEESKALASSGKIRENAKIMTAKLKIEGNPTIVPNTVINMAGVFKPHQGAWLVTKVTHDISSGYTTTLDMDKGFKSNKTKGKKAKSKKSGAGGEAPPAEKIYAYDANGNEVRVDKKEFDRKIIKR